MWSGRSCGRREDGSERSCPSAQTRHSWSCSWCTPRTAVEDKVVQGPLFGIVQPTSTKTLIICCALRRRSDGRSHKGDPHLILPAADSREEHQEGQRSDQNAGGDVIQDCLPLTMRNAILASLRSLPIQRRRGNFRDFVVCRRMKSSGQSARVVQRHLPPDDVFVELCQRLG